MRCRWLVALLAIWLLPVLAADEAPPKLEAGKSFTVQFPDLPPTLAELLDPKGIKPMMTVFLPRNYDPQRKHPLVILLSGGAGSRGGNPGVARKVTEERDFVCVDWPLFKEQAKAGSPVMVLRPEDSRFAWPHYRTMLDKLEQLVPNLDPKQRVIGGFSNGAHMTQGLVDESDQEFSRHFTAFLFVEGGGRMQHWEYLKDRPALLAHGGQNPRTVRRAAEIRDAALLAGVKIKLHEMAGTGHAFPESQYPAVRAWLRGPALGQTGDQAAAAPAENQP